MTREYPLARRWTQQHARSHILCTKLQPGQQRESPFPLPKAEQGRGGAIPGMAQRCLSAAVLAILLAACAMGRELQQAAAPVEPISLARAASSDQASTDLNRQKLISSSNTGSVTATTLQPQSSQKRTLDQVNSDAPTITDPSTKVSVRPTASSQLLSSQAQTAPSLDTAQNTAQNAQTATAQAQSGGQQQVGVVNPYDVQGASPLDNNLITGDYVSQQQGIRIATPLFGTGYNFCIGENCRGTCMHACMHALAKIWRTDTSL